MLKKSPTINHNANPVNVTSEIKRNLLTLGNNNNKNNKYSMRLNSSRFRDAILSKRKDEP